MSKPEDILCERARRALLADIEKTIAERDSGPALHGLVQQTREVNRQLANIDKRLEKLEALEKVQIANLTYRDDVVRPVRESRP